MGLDVPALITSLGLDLTPDREAAVRQQLAILTGHAENVRHSLAGLADDRP